MGVLLVELFLTTTDGVCLLCLGLQLGLPEALGLNS